MKIDLGLIVEMGWFSPIRLKFYECLELIDLFLVEFFEIIAFGEAMNLMNKGVCWIAWIPMIVGKGWFSPFNIEY